MAAKINPTQAAFLAVPEHADVTNYKLEIVRASDGVLVQSTDVGKPAPNAANDIVVPLVKTSELANNVEHVFHVVANGAGVSKRSDVPSNPFVFVVVPSAPTNLRAQ